MQKLFWERDCLKKKEKKKELFEKTSLPIFFVKYLKDFFYRKDAF